MLGEAACALLLSNEKSDLCISGIEVSNEAHAVTAPSSDGRGLYKCITKLLSTSPDLAFAHGTGTIANDNVEDSVFKRLDIDFGYSFPITASKWSVGHTLGASGLVDLMSAIACIKKQEAFPIKGLNSLEHLKVNSYLTSNIKKEINSVLISSLGFGGTNAALLLNRSKI
jgi:3-oxoacyl-(acyl-carrier-protein) synthase